MESTRQQKIARLIQKDLGNIFLKSGSMFDGAMVTVTKVQVARDLSFARVWLSLFTTGDKGKILEDIRGRSKEIRHLLGNAERYQLRIIPELQFLIDDSLDYIENIENLLKH